MITLNYRDILPKAKSVGHAMVTQLDDIIAQVSTWFQVEHKEDGTHGDVTADTLEVTGLTTLHEVTIETVTVDNLTVTEDALVSGNLQVTGDTTLNGPVQANSSVIAAGTIASLADVTASGSFIAAPLSTPPKAVINATGVGDIRERQRTVAMGEWQTFTTAWSSSGTQPSIGDGTLAARYMLIGKTLWFEIVLTFGSTTNGGTGTWFFTVPIQIANLIGQVPGPCGVANAANAGVANFPATTLTVTAGSPSAVTALDDVNSLGWSATNPFAFGIGDSAILKGSYEF